MTDGDQCMRVALGFIQGIATTSRVLNGVTKLQTKKAKEEEMKILSSNLKMNVEAFNRTAKRDCGVDPLAEGEWGRAVLYVEEAIDSMSEGNPEQALKDLHNALYRAVDVSWQ